MNTLHDYIEFFLVAAVICFLIMIMFLLLLSFFTAVYFSVKWFLNTAAEAIHYYFCRDKDAE